MTEPTSFNRRGEHTVSADTMTLADEWGRAAREETDPVRRAIAVAGHAECLRELRRQRSRG